MEKINKETRSLRDLVSNLRFKPNTSITAQVDMNTHPFRDNRFFSFSANKLAFEEYQKCLSLMQNRMGDTLENLNPEETLRLMGNYMIVMNQISSIEENHLESLEELAIDLIRDLYNIPNNIDLKAFLRPMDEMPDLRDQEDEEEMEMEEQEEEEVSPERKAFIDKEIQKRIILNSFVHGSSIHIWKSSYHIVRDQLNIMDTRLVGLYDKYSALVSFLMWQFSVDFMQQAIDNNGAMVQGLNTVEFSTNEEQDEEQEDEDENEEENSIDATLTGYAINFPVLLHELSKSVIDYLITNGIPQDFTPAEYDYYYSRADRYTNEVWHYFFGPTLWTGLLKTVEKTPDELPYVISKLSELEYEELADLCNLMVYNQEEARTKLEELEIL